MGYQVAACPPLAVTMARYLDVIGRLADTREPRFWPMYDDLHRMHIKDNWEDFSLWTRSHEDSFLEAESEWHFTITIRNDSASRVKCHSCKQTGHLERDCPHKHSSQPFRNDPGAEGQVCYQYNSGNCKSPAKLDGSMNAAFVEENIGDATATNKPTDFSKLTPLRWQAFQRLLRRHPDREYVNSLLSMLKHGAAIGYWGPHFARQIPNAVSAHIRPEILRQMVEKEVNLGHTRGPFQTPPFPNFICSSLGLVPKKPDGFRLILDLSLPFYDSVNYYIDEQEFPLEYCNVDDAVLAWKGLEKVQ